jgi:hypothetical protein
MAPTSGAGPGKRGDRRPGRRDRATLTRRGVLAGLVGSLGFTIGGASRPGGPARAREPSSGGIDEAAGAVPPLPLPDSAFVRGAGRDAIPAIDAPAFAAGWDRPVPIRDEFGTRTATLSLAEFDPVLGVALGGDTRAYPLRVLAWHEVVNDWFPDPETDGRQPVLVTYCPLCGSGVVARRRVDGVATTFGVSGLLYRDNLVLYDTATGSRWSQLLATAVQGPATGTRLDLLPVTVSTWGAWRGRHPDTSVLLPPPYSGTVAARESPRNYALDPYAAYRTNDRLGFGEGGYTAEDGAPFDDDRLHPKTYVLGISRDDDARAYPLPVVAEAGVATDTVGDLPVVVTAVDDDLVAYDRRVRDRVRTFERVDAGHLAAGGSRWAVESGVAVDGPHRGERLRRLRATGQFWFAWLQLYPGTTVWGVDR